VTVAVRGTLSFVQHRPNCAVATDAPAHLDHSMYVVDDVATAFSPVMIGKPSRLWPVSLG